MIISRDHLWQFLQREAFTCKIVELYEEIELQQKLTQFFNRAVYYGVLAYDKVGRQDGAKDSLAGVVLRRAKQGQSEYQNDER